MKKQTKKKPKKPNDPKVTFRRTKEWQTFRTTIKKKQKKDPVTGSPLTKRLQSSSPG